MSWQLFQNRTDAPKKKRPTPTFYFLMEADAPLFGSVRPFFNNLKLMEEQIHKFGSSSNLWKILIFEDMKSWEEHHQKGSVRLQHLHFFDKDGRTSF